jgi:hypothetical protein
LRSFGTVEPAPGGALVRGDPVDVPGLARALVTSGFSLQGLTRETDGLEDLFLELVRGGK